VISCYEHTETVKPFTEAICTFKRGDHGCWTLLNLICLHLNYLILQKVQHLT